MLFSHPPFVPHMAKSDTFLRLAEHFGFLQTNKSKSPKAGCEEGSKHPYM